MTHPRSISDRLLPKGRKKGESSVSHTKTLMERANSRNQLSPLPARSLIACYRRDARKIGEGFGEWSEAPSYEEPTEKVALFEVGLHRLTLHVGCYN